MVHAQGLLLQSPVTHWATRKPVVGELRRRCLLFLFPLLRLLLLLDRLRLRVCAGALHRLRPVLQRGPRGGALALEAGGAPQQLLQGGVAAQHGWAVRSSPGGAGGIASYATDSGAGAGGPGRGLAGRAMALGGPDTGRRRGGRPRSGAAENGSRNGGGGGEVWVAPGRCGAWGGGGGGGASLGPGANGDWGGAQRAGGPVPPEVCLDGRVLLGLLPLTADCPTRARTTPSLPLSLSPRADARDVIMCPCIRPSPGWWLWC